MLRDAMTGILALVLVAAAAPAAERTTVQFGEHYALEVPAGYALKDVTPGPIDFVLYSLTEKRTGGVKCTLYVGNHSGFPKLRWSGRLTESNQGGGTRKEFRSSDRVEGLMTFSGLTYKDSAGSPFELIHYFADHLSVGDMKAVTAMLDSIRIAKKNLK